MTTKHTPGPWVVDDDRQPHRLRSMGILMVVAEAGGMPGIIINQGAITKADEANARLIAEAPAMLEALREMLHMVSNVLTDSQLDHVTCGKTIRKAITPARAILARIDGAA